MIGDLGSDLADCGSGNGGVARTCTSLVEKGRPVLTCMDDPQDEQPARFDPVDDEMRPGATNSNRWPELPPLSRDFGIEEEPVKLTDDRANVRVCLSDGPAQNRVVLYRIKVSLGCRRQSVFSCARLRHSVPASGQEMPRHRTARPGRSTGPDRRVPATRRSRAAGPGRAGSGPARSRSNCFIARHGSGSRPSPSSRQARKRLFFPS